MAGRFWLYAKAVILRFLMRIGMFLHRFPLPSPPPPSFKRTIPSDSRRCRPLTLHFYTPKGYKKDKENGQKYPVVVNFHGGGFCLGKATDDGRWANALVQAANAVVVSVEYRLAPESPFPAAVDDGVDALLYLGANSADLSLDTTRIALTGFSAGGNLAFSVPLRLRFRHGDDSANGPNLSLDRYESTRSLLNSPSNIQSNLQIVSICSWYPVLDFVLPRDVRRNRSIFPEKALPPFLTDLFDESYLPNLPDRSSPFASPGLAPDRMLAEALPRDIFIYMCEWDMLLKEGQDFVKRLETMDKRVRSMMIEQSAHAWDKSINPFRDLKPVNIFYQVACEGLRTTLER